MGRELHRPAEQGRLRRKPRAQDHPRWGLSVNFRIRPPTAEQFPRKAGEAPHVGSFLSSLPLRATVACAPGAGAQEILGQCLRLPAILQTDPLTWVFSLNLSLGRTAPEFPVFWKGSLKPQPSASETKL